MCNIKKKKKASLDLKNNHLDLSEIIYINLLNKSFTFSKKINYYQSQFVHRSS